MTRDEVLNEAAQVWHEILENLARELDTQLEQ